MIRGNFDYHTRPETPPLVIGAFAVTLEPDHFSKNLIDPPPSGGPIKVKSGGESVAVFLEEMMNVGEASRVTGLPVKTIRYYDEIGLVHPDRDNNGYRQFDEYSVNKLHFIKRARGLGFSVGDCRTLLSLYEDQDRSSADVKLIAQEHLASVETKIAQTRQFRNVLVYLVDSCNGDHRPECPILDGLSGTSTNETQH